ncbi:alpha-glucuronidase family glycosyl hydrolase [Actinopolymorpha alba]|uniref:alpha-glucuronidase family glycosyl hydrolase n=1 Tax=Actinopolymorpha alba TaxID=533267 RepID=UPI000A07BC8D|nr:alpha-glucuronidase family glycosyl hydrolase [Actinopolymorpha alba]
MHDHVTRRQLLAGAGVLAGGLFLPPGSMAWATTRPDGPQPSGEDGHELWLRYRLVDDARLLTSYRRALTHVVVPDGGKVLGSAVDELCRGLSALTGRTVPREQAPSGDGALIVGTPESSRFVADAVEPDVLRGLGPEGYVLLRRQIGGRDAILVAGNAERGALYGAFHLLRLLQTHESLTTLDVVERPANPLRLANHWDNLDRSVERGYAGQSIWHWEELPEILPHYVTYARALASLGMNGTVVNNVNANSAFLSTEMLRQLTGLADVLRAWGVNFYLSANFACPITLGGLPTADPFDEDVQAWWRDKAVEIYDLIPDFGGFLVKADSEGQPGPLTYGRTHADGANLLARAVEPHGGIVMWRAFVHDFDPRTWAHKSYQTFTPLDGAFADNVVLQIKNGPIDFQVREPVHPLFGALPRTNSMLELQITQEYTGQSTHLCYLVPMWKEVYDFDTHAAGAGTTVADIVAGTTYDRRQGGVAGVMNVGSDVDWTRHQLAAANTHGFGRLAWNPRLDPAQVAEEWVRMTFGSHPQVVQVLTRMLLRSWEIYESYTSPLGVGFMIAGDHFTPNPEGNAPWNQANSEGTGFDRTVATGIGYTGLYHPPVARVFESLVTCPDELLLFMHHVPYTHRLHSGSTVIQHIYDSHFDGLDDAERLRRQWRSLGSRIDERRYAEILGRFDRQVEHATLWRDSIVSYYFERSRIPDPAREWVQLRPAESRVFLGGWPNVLRLSVGNASTTGRAVTVGFAAKDGWSTGTDTTTLTPREFGDVSIPVTPPIKPEITTLRAEVNAGGLGVLQPLVDTITAPAGSHCFLALDAGSASSPIMPSYRRLAPGDAWDPQRGYGWVGAAPQSRDRGRPDPLRQDFVNDVAARTLRIAVPAGTFEAYLLVGDAGADSFPTFVRSGGELVAESAFMTGGSYAWLSFMLDGGAAGRTVDLELSGVPGQHWHLNALALRDPRAEPPPIVVTGIDVPLLMVGGRDHSVTIEVANLTEADAISVTAAATVPDGWSSRPGTVTVDAGGTARIEAVVVPGEEPTFARLQLEVSAEGRTVGGGRQNVEVLGVPDGAGVVHALDAGPATSPLLASYQRLAPGDGWSTAAGYGWVGPAPQSRDRGVPDPLRRDFVNDTVARTLRLAIPAGPHDAYLLVGDGTQPSQPTYVRSEGVLLVASRPLGTGEFTWERFTLDGGASGREIDLELSGTPNDHWHLAALLVRPA